MDRYTERKEEQSDIIDYRKMDIWIHFLSKKKEPIAMSQKIFFNIVALTGSIEKLKTNFPTNLGLWFLNLAYIFL